ncbi:MAG: GAF domain-containing protein, partial [Anaerolineae bacterium]|nr:GAF domain-containing protein [Anaerolineae bacterium]
YSDREKRVYQTLADQAIIAIENRRLVETLRRERDQAALLHQIDQTLSQSTSPMEVKANILSFTNLIGARYGEVFISDRKDYSTFISNIPERRSLQITSLEALQIAGLCPELELKALQKQEIVILPADKIETIKDNYPSLATIQTVITAPFTSRHSGLSGIVQFLFAESGPSQTDNIEVLSSITSQAAAILDNLRLIEQTRQALSETEILYETTRSFNVAQHPEELLSILADSLLTFDPLLTNEVDNMAIGLLPDPGQLPPIQRLNIVARWNKPGYDVLLSESKITSEYYGFIPDLTHKEAQVIAYSQLDAPTQSKIDQYFGKARTIIAVPLKVGYHWLGTLFLTSHLENATFKSSWLSQITTLAGQAAVVIQNLQLVEETQQTLYYSETLSQLGQELLVADTPAAIYDAALQAVAATEPQRGAAIFRYKFYDTNRFTAHLVAKWDNPGQSWPQDADLNMTFSSEQVGHTLFTLLNAGHTVVAKRVAEDGRFSIELKQMLAKARVESMVVVPLWYNQQISGFLLAAHAFQTRFSSEITRLYEDITLQMSGALENRRLFEEAEYRATLLQTAADVSRAATRYLDLDTLMTESVNLIRDRFGYSHVSIFLLDDYRQFAVVKASTGEIGQKMLAAEHKLAVGGQSIVGAATGRAQARIALDVKQDTGHYKNPLLPETRSEMALPFIVQGKVIGALDVQSTEKDAFSEQDITILQSMADQIANAIFAAQSAQETQETLAHMQKLNEHYLREQWGEFIRERQAITG